MAKFNVDDGVQFTNVRDGMSGWLVGRICVVQEVHGNNIYVIDSNGSELLGYEDELTAYP